MQVIPVIILLVGVIAYFIVIPNIYGRVISSVDWLFTDPQNIIDTLRDPNAVLPQVNKLKARRNSKQLDSLIYSVKKLEEKLSVESDFGYGKSSVINCENNIARQIQFLLDTAPCIENDDFEKNIKAMNTAVMNINSLLRKRIELKKR